MSKTNTKNNRKNILPGLTLIVLLISVSLNIFLISKLNFERYTSDTNLALAASENWASNYCKFSGNMTDKEIEENLKKIPPLSNAVIEDYEGAKTLYVSYMQKNSIFSQNWADSRFQIKECK